MTTANIHFIEKATGKMIAKRYNCVQIPRLGEECRFADDQFFTVVHVVNVFDEPGNGYRVNIGLKKVEK